MPPETVGPLGDPKNNTLTGIAIPTVILITTEAFTTTTASVDSTMVFEVVETADFILALLMEVSTRTQPLTVKVSRIVRILSLPNQ